MGITLVLHQHASLPVSRALISNQPKPGSLSENSSQYIVAKSECTGEFVSGGEFGFEALRRNAGHASREKATAHSIWAHSEDVRRRNEAYLGP